MRPCPEAEVRLSSPRARAAKSIILRWSVVWCRLKFAGVGVDALHAAVRDQEVRRCIVAELRSCPPRAVLTESRTGNSSSASTISESSTTSASETRTSSSPRETRPESTCRSSSTSTRSFYEAGARKDEVLPDAELRAGEWDLLRLRTQMLNAAVREILDLLEDRKSAPYA